MNTINDFESAVDRVAALQLDVRGLKKSMDDDIAKVRDKYGPKIEERMEEVKALTAQAKKFCVANRKVILGKSKHRETRHATVGLEKDPPSLVLRGREWSEEKVIDAIKECRPDLVPSAIIIKRSLNKRALSSLTDEQLFPLGLKRRQTEKFTILPKSEEPKRITA